MKLEVSSLVLVTRSKKASRPERRVNILFVNGETGTLSLEDKTRQDKTKSSGTCVGGKSDSVVAAPDMIINISDLQTIF